MANSEKQTTPAESNNENKPSRRERPVNPFIRLIVNRLFMLGALIVVIVVGFGSCALFAPAFFAQTIKAAQSAGLSVYTVVLGITGNPALQVVSYESDVSAQTTVNRDMGVLTLLYGESANIVGTVHVSLGADLKNKQFGVLNCDLDVNTIRVSEQHAPLAGSAFDPQKIKQLAYVALEKQAALLAVQKYWPQARQGLTGQFASWALGVIVPEMPTLTDCPFNVSASAATTAATQAP
jgi:hypothetical protein